MKETPKNKGKKPAAKRGRTPKEKVHRHLADKEDIITDEDLKEVVVGVDAVDLKNPDEPTIATEDIPDKKIITPWDVVDEKE